MAANTSNTHPKDELYPAGPHAVEKLGDGMMLPTGSATATEGFGIGTSNGVGEGGDGSDVLGTEVRGGLVVMGVGSTGGNRGA